MITETDLYVGAEVTVTNRESRYVARSGVVVGRDSNGILVDIEGVRLHFARHELVLAGAR